MDYSLYGPCFWPVSDFWDGVIPLETAFPEEQNGANFSFLYIAHSSEGLPKHLHGFWPKSEKFDFSKTYHQKGRLKRSILERISAL